jgi:hypothetical protein
MMFVYFLMSFFMMIQNEQTPSCPLYADSHCCTPLYDSFIGNGTQTTLHLHTIFSLKYRKVDLLWNSFICFCFVWGVFCFLGTDLLTEEVAMKLDLTNHPYCSAAIKNLACAQCAPDQGSHSFTPIHTLSQHNTIRCKKEGMYVL